MPMKDILPLLASGQHLTIEHTVEAFEQIMSGQATPAQIAALLAMIQVRGPSVEEITGAARVMRAKVTPVAVPPGLTAIDTCGTGGDHGGTFNISTAAALVVAAAGRPQGIVVAKHGNRSVTSNSGSSQVLEALGVRLAVAPANQSRCLDEAGICFCFAPAHHPAMKHVAPIRQELGFRTIFNILGPLTNPAGARRQVIGVFSTGLTEPLAHVLKNLGAEHAMIVHGLSSEDAGMDELITHGDSQISHLRHGEITTYLLDPKDLGLKPGRLDDIKAKDPQTSAAMIRDILGGRHGHARDIVCLNAAAALVVAELVLDMHDGLAMAATAIDSGAAAQALQKLVKATNEDATGPAGRP